MKLSHYDSNWNFMAKALERSLWALPHPYVTNNELEVMLGGSPDSRYSKVKRLLAEQKLLRIRRGLYCITDHAVNLHPFALAQYIYGPSYISLESALSFHGLIPETVFTVTSATGRRAKDFGTPLGVFSYLHLPSENLFTGIELVKENGYTFFMAKPWKAICDYIFCYKKDWDNLKPLVESLRVNREALPLLRDEEIFLFDEYYRHTRVSKFLKGIRKELS
jgi:predicted transcriptional regulator of viral defense system